MPNKEGSWSTMTDLAASFRTDRLGQSAVSIEVELCGGRSSSSQLLACRFITRYYVHQFTWDKLGAGSNCADTDVYDRLLLMER